MNNYICHDCKTSFSTYIKYPVLARCDACYKIKRAYPSKDPYDYHLYLCTDGCGYELQDRGEEVNKSTIDTRECPSCKGRLGYSGYQGNIVSARTTGSYVGEKTFRDGSRTSKNKRTAKEEARIPINIIDEKPDGSYKVTRIGKKSDIDNE